MAFRGRNLAVSSKNHYNSGKKTIRNMGKANVYGNPKVYHFPIVGKITFNPTDFQIESVKT